MFIAELLIVDGVTDQHQQKHAHGELSDAVILEFRKLPADLCIIAEEFVNETGKAEQDHVDRVSSAVGIVILLFGIQHDEHAHQQNGGGLDQLDREQPCVLILIPDAEGAV